jgi:hypothetical protein
MVQILSKCLLELKRKIVKSKKSSQNKLHKLRLLNQREIQKSQGFFDGRFVERKEDSLKKYKRNPKHKNKEN